LPFRGSRTAEVSVVIPTWNGGKTIGKCLNALRNQSFGRCFEILVVDDGSTDNTLDVLASYPEVLVISQANAGPASARNRGARDASGEVILFTDDDCAPARDWLTEMLRPFDDPEVVGAKGVYRTHQHELVARFVQCEYEDRYRVMSHEPSIDFVDTYSAGFRHRQFTEIGGYDVSFPAACAEDVELSYRMSRKGWKMVFAPAAVVYHQHPCTMGNYLRRKVKFAFWRVVAVKQNPTKAVKDSHTPQLMKMQMLLAPALAAALASEFFGLSSMPLATILVLLFAVSTLPFALRAFPKDRSVAVLAPLLLAARACAQFFGVASAALYLVGVSVGSFGAISRSNARLPRA